MLRPAAGEVETLWSPTVQKVLESNALMPSVAVDFLSQDDLNLARTQHLDLKMYIKAKGIPCPGSLLLEEVPAADPPAGSGESNADLASRLPPGSMERKLAILDIINQHSQGQLRVWGGQWQKKWDELNIPGWAMSGRQEHLRPLESCTRPYGPTGDFHQFVRFTAEELEDQVNQGLRPPQDTIQALAQSSFNLVFPKPVPQVGTPEQFEGNLRDLAEHATCSGLPDTGTRLRREGPPQVAKAHSDSKGSQNICSHRMWTHGGTYTKKWGNSWPPNPFSPIRRPVSWNCPLQQSMTLRPICGRERFVTNGSVSPSAHSRSWTRSTPSLQPSSAPRRRW